MRTSRKETVRPTQNDGNFKEAEKLSWRKKDLKTALNPGKDFDVQGRQEESGKQNGYKEKVGSKALQG